MIDPVIPGSIEEKKDYVHHIVWLVFASICLVGGLIFSICNPLSGPIGWWLLWGFICGIAFIVPVAKSIIKFVKVGRAIGKNRKHTYVNVSGSGGNYEVNSTTVDERGGWGYAGFCISFLAWIFILCIAGQIALITKIAWTLYLVIGYLKEKKVIQN